VFATRSQLDARLAVFLGGRIAEKIIFDDISTGASSDIRQSTDWARKMVTVYGMSDKLGPRTFGQKEELIFLGREISEQRDYSEKTALQIDAEVNQFIQKASETATTILTENKDRLIHLAQLLIAKENLEGAELEAAFNEPVTTPIPAGVPAVEKNSSQIASPKLAPIPNPNPASNPMPSV
jgi:cell division protease FtsH